jgi:hypothetical protein
MERHRQTVRVTERHEPPHGRRAYRICASASAAQVSGLGVFRCRTVRARSMLLLLMVAKSDLPFCTSCGRHNQQISGFPTAVTPVNFSVLPYLPAWSLPEIARHFSTYQSGAVHACSHMPIRIMANPLQPHTILLVIEGRRLVLARCKPIPHGNNLHA